VSDAPGTERRPAFYAARPGGWRDWWTLLHLPYTAWHLAYVVIGASLAPRVEVSRMVATLLAFLFAVGFAAHALDELHGRPLRTRIPNAALVVVTVLGLGGAVALGIVGLSRVGWPLIPFMVVGPLLVVAYNWELWGGRIHTDAGFALAWGAFPVLVAYVAQTGRLAASPIIAAAAAFALSVAQRRLSTPARVIRRRASGVEGRIILRNGDSIPLDERTLLAPLERTLHALSWGVVLVAAALAVARLG
jgi:nitrogen fixation protein